MKDKNTRNLLAEAKFYEGYARWRDQDNRYETWAESVSRVMDMHRDFYKERMCDELAILVDKAEELYKDRCVLGAQRALQFGGDQILRNHMKIYNCLSTYADRPEFFGELFFNLLSGCGVGFSVQQHHIDRLPQIAPRKGQAKIHVIDDSIEGWATALDVLMSSFFVGGGKHPEYAGRRVYFDLTQIRPLGSFISGGFKAPGPEPLRKALDKIEHLLQGEVLKNNDTLRPIHVYDICMHAADAVLAGGVRRSATICLFSPDDHEMITAKTGNWHVDNPQRARSNNSAVIVRKNANRAQFAHIMDCIKEFGEPGFVFLNQPNIQQTHVLKLVSTLSGLMKKESIIVEHKDVTYLKSMVHNVKPKKDFWNFVKLLLSLEHYKLDTRISNLSVTSHGKSLKGKH